MNNVDRRRSAARASTGQHGAALIVGMVLLVILTLLAISGMNTATTELFMAGNEKYQENAFQAAETGIERTIATAAFNPAVVPPANPPQVDLGDNNSYAARVLPRGCERLVAFFVHDVLRVGASAPAAALRRWRASAMRRAGNGTAVPCLSARFSADFAPS